MCFAVCDRWSPSCFLPSDLFLQFGAEQQVGEKEDMPQLPGSLHQLHHETVLQQLPVLWRQQTTAVASDARQHDVVKNTTVGKNKSSQIKASITSVVKTSIISAMTHFHESQERVGSILWTVDAVSLCWGFIPASLLQTPTPDLTVWEMWSVRFKSCIPWPCATNYWRWTRVIPAGFTHSS